MAMVNCKSIALLTAVSLLVAFILDSLIKAQYFSKLYDHFPGNCTKFNLNGSEDFALFPNDHALFSSGLEIFGNRIRPPAGIFMLDLQDTEPQPVKLSFEGDFLSKNSPDFNPHGLGSWVTESGEYLLYVVNHRDEGDHIESFVYHPGSKSLVHRKSISDPEIYNINDVVLVGKDKVYATRDHYYKGLHLKELETALRVAYASVLYIDASGEVKMAADKRWYANGIAKSNDGRFIYLSECGAGTVTALTRNEDNTLTELKEIFLQVAPDNVFVSPVNGHLWVGIIAKPLEFIEYSRHHDPANTPCGGRVLHVAIDETAENPFDNYQVEEVFSTSGKMIGATSGALYHNKKLLVGTIRTGLMVCDVPYLIYP